MTPFKSVPVVYVIFVVLKHVFLAPFEGIIGVGSEHLTVFELFLNISDSHVEIFPVVILTKINSRISPFRDLK